MGKLGNGEMGKLGKDKWSDRHDIALPPEQEEPELERVVELVAEIVFAKELPET